MKCFMSCSRLLIPTLCLVAVFEAKATGSDDKAWSQLLNEQREKHSAQSFTESFASGAASFVIGTYGSNYGKKGVVTASVYSFLQTGGVFLMAQGLRTYLEVSPLLTFDSSFQRKGNMSYKEFRRTWLSTIEKNNFAEDVSDLFLWSSLGTIYSVAGIREPSSSATLRSVYFFLAANSIILASAAGYRLYLASSSVDQSATSLSVVPASLGFAVSLERNW